MRNRPRLTYVIPTMSVGGTERQVVELVRGLADDFDISIICIHEDGGFIGDVRRLGAYVRVLNAKGGWDFTMIPQLRRVMDGRLPDIVHTFLFGFDAYTNWVARRLGVPVVLSSRRELAVWQGWRHRAMQRLANRMVDAVAANSQAVADYARLQEKSPASLYRVIPNGIDVERFSPTCSALESKRKFRMENIGQVVGMVANFSPVKDHLLFMNMAEVLLKQHPDLHFLLVGSGKLVHEMGDLIKQRKRSKSFNRVSTTNEIVDMYNMMDVKVLTSKMEGFPNAVMEAMAAGRPVVASAVGGIVELVEHEKTGLLVSDRRPEAFAEAVHWLLTHPEEAQQMGQRARQWVAEHLSMESMVSAYRNLYFELLEKKQPRG